MKNDVDIKYVVIILAIGRSENPEGGSINVVGTICPLIQKELMYVPAKIWG